VAGADAVLKLFGDAGFDRAAAFAEADADGSGGLNAAELSSMLFRHGIMLGRDEIGRLIQARGGLRRHCSAHSAARHIAFPDMARSGRPPEAH
jgi:hypothetical protein